MPSADYIIRPIATDAVTRDTCYLPTDWSKLQGIIDCGFKGTDSDYDTASVCQRLKRSKVGVSRSACQCPLRTAAPLKTLRRR